MNQLVVWELMFNLGHPENHTLFHLMLELT